MISTGSAEMDAVCAAYRSIIGEIADEVAARTAQISKLSAENISLRNELAGKKESLRNWWADGKPAEGPPPF